MKILLDTRFGGINDLPGGMFTPLGITFSSEQVHMRVVQAELELPDELKELADTIMKIKKPPSDSRVYHFRRARLTGDSLEIEVGLSWYRYTLLHTAFEPRMLDQHPEFAKRLESYPSLKPLFGDDLVGPLSSGVGITTVVVTSDERTVMVRRSKERVSVNADLDHPGSAEEVNFKEGASGDINLADVALRGATEELGLPVGKDDILFLGLCIDGRYLWPGVIARVKVPLTFEQVRLSSKEAEDWWERDGEVWALPYTPDGLARVLRQAANPPGEGGMTGFGAMALLAAGVVDFGQSKMLDACR